MKNTTKLKHILQLYTVSLDMDAEEQIHLSLFSKHKSGTATFADKSYTKVMGRAFSHMMKTVKEQTKKR